MASSVSSLSYLDPPVYQNAALPTATPSAAPSNGVSATAEIQAIQKQGDFQRFLNDSLAAALLQPASGVNTGTDSSTLISNMLQQVLGAYQAPVEPPV